LPKLTRMCKLSTDYYPDLHIELTETYITFHIDDNVDPSQFICNDCYSELVKFDYETVQYTPVHYANKLLALRKKISNLKSGVKSKSSNLKIYNLTQLLPYAQYCLEEACIKQIAYEQFYNINAQNDMSNDNPIKV
jgi:hypothetical protein